MRRRVGIIILLILLFALGAGYYISVLFVEETETKNLIRTVPPHYDKQYITIGFVQTGKESDWRDANTQNYLDVFVEANGYKLIYVDGNSDPVRQLKATQDLISQNVDYIVLQPIVEEGWEDTLKQAKVAGIPVIVADRQVDADPSLYTTWIGSDFYKEGEKAIAWLEDYLKDQGREQEQIDIVLLTGTPGASATIGRTDSVLAGIDAHDNWKLMASECGDFTQGQGQSVMEGLLKGKINGNEIDVIISENDNMAFGAMIALDNRGLSYGTKGNIIVVSFDALGETFHRMIRGEMHVSVECNPLLAPTVEKVIKKLEQGEKVDKKYYTKESVYTFENAAKYVDSRTY